MANKKRNTVVEEKIKNAEQAILSYAYDRSLDTAIEYLKAHDPENSVLATIKDFENDRPTLKALNALYRADKAREAQDTAELERIATFLGNYKQYRNTAELKAEANKILSEVQGNHEQVAAVRTLIDEAEKQNRMVEMHEKVQNSVPSMTDDDILANAMGIESIYNNSDIQSEIYEETVKKAKKTVTIDDEDSVVQNEDDLWVAKMMSALNEVTTTRMDDAGFAAKNAQEKKEELKEAAVSNFWSNLARMAGASAVDEQADIEANDRNSLQAEKDCVNGKAVTIKANQFFANIEAVKEKMQRKVEQLKEKGKNKSSSWLSDKLAKFNAFTDKHFGITPVEFGKEMIGYFSHARGITNTVATVALVGAAAYSIPVGLAAAAAYGIYQSFAPSKWTIYEKKKANYDAAKAKGDKEEMKVWSGWNGIRNAYKAIQANPKEKKKFDSQRATNMKYGLASAAVVGLATPVIVGGGAMLGLSGAAAYYATRALSSGLRLTGANTNAYVQMKDAKNQFKEDVAAQSEDAAKSEKAYKRARTYFGLGIVGALFSEISMANSAADAYQADYAMGVDHNPDHVTPPAAEQHDFADVDSIVNSQSGDTNVDGADVAGAGVDAQPTEIDIPDQPISISQEHWDELHRKVTGIFANHAEIFGLDNRNPDEAFAQMWTNIENAKAAGILPADKPTDEILYQYEKLIEYTEEGDPLKGTEYLKTVLDEDVKPMYHVDKEQMAALNDIILCGKKVEISVEDLTNSLNRIDTSDGTYHGAGEGIGVTNNYFVGHGRECDDGVNAWRQGDKHVVKVAKVPAPAPEPTPVDVKIEQTPTVTEVKQPDANIDLSYKQEVITGGTAPAEKGFKAPLDPLQKIDGDASKGQAFGNWVKIRGKGNGM